MRLMVCTCRCRLTPLLTPRDLISMVTGKRIHLQKSASPLSLLVLKIFSKHSKWFLRYYYCTFGNRLYLFFLLNVIWQLTNHDIFLLRTFKIMKKKKIPPCDILFIYVMLSFVTRNFRLLPLMPWHERANIYKTKQLRWD